MATDPTIKLKREQFDEERERGERKRERKII